MINEIDKCEEIGYEIYLDCVEKLEEFPNYMRASATNAIATAYLQEHCDNHIAIFFANKLIQDCKRIINNIEQKNE